MPNRKVGVFPCMSMDTRALVMAGKISREAGWIGGADEEQGGWNMMAKKDGECKLGLGRG